MGLLDKDIVMRDKIELYNNIAHSGDCTGRLSAEMQVFPSPRIIWDLECLEDMACHPEIQQQQQLKYPLLGKHFSIETAFATVTRGWPGHRSLSVGGITPQAVYGDLEDTFDHFSFYLPNARFQQVNYHGTQKALWQYLVFLEDKDSPPMASMPGGLYLDVALDETSRVSLETRQQSLEWLDPQERSVGTFVTTVGWLGYSGGRSVPLGNALARLHTLGTLLSFANGGYTAPLYVKGMADPTEDRESSAVASVFKITPVELLGYSWLANDSDLENFVQCFATFERMIQGSPWNEVFPLVLSWYLQAIQPDSAQVRGKPRHVVANALGAALERLSLAILLESTGDRRGSVQDKVKKMMDVMGVSDSCPLHKDEDIVSFFDVRNEATHPKRDLQLSTQERDRLIDLAVVWIEEALLWRLGYSGKYRVSELGRSIDPCYDIDTRNSDW